jgi:hypothetical protein
MVQRPQKTKLNNYSRCHAELDSASLTNEDPELNSG